MKTLKITVQYDGTNFFGWQLQQGKRTVQETLEKAISQVLGETIVLEASGRTDKGVHALRQVCTFQSETSFAFERLMYPVNALLPEDVSVLSCEEAEDGFHARFHAKRKTYEYHFFVSEFRNPLRERFALRISRPLNEEAMMQAANMLQGTHDFSSFAVAKSKKENGVRTVHSCTLTCTGNQTYCVTVCGNGFMHNMVRIMVGTMVDCGLGKIKPKDIENIFQSKNRSAAGKTLSPNGLILVGVEYD